MVLDGADQQSAPAIVGRSARPVQALDGEVVGFRPAAGEYDFAGTGAERLGKGLPRLLDDTAGMATGSVQGGGIADPPQLRGHGLDRFREHRSGRRVVQVGHRGRV